MRHEIRALAVLFTCLIFVLPRLSKIVRRRWLQSKIPVFSDDQPSGRAASKRLGEDPIGFLQRGLSKHPEGFQINGDLGRLIIIPPQYGQLVNANPKFSSLEPLQDFLRFDLPGGEGLFEIHNSNHDLFVSMLRTKLTQNNSELNQNLMLEAKSAFDDAWGCNTEWHDVSVRSSIIHIVSRMSTRIFLGERLCRDSTWLRIVAEYVIKLFEASRELRFMPGPLAGIYHAFSKQGTALRAQVREARDIAQPFIDETLQKLEIAKEKQTTKPFGAIAWLHEAAQGKKYDAVAMQLGISAVGIHTTTDLVSQTVLELAMHPEILEPLREEITAVKKGDSGWLASTAALQNLKLLDSVLKETQRLKPVGGATTQRRSLEETTLPNGMVIPMDSTVVTAMSRMWSPDVYSSPMTWDGYRFMKMRSAANPQYARTAQLVAPSIEHLGFGQGIHACPGRFFAATEAKIALIYIIENFDLELKGGEEASKPMIFGLGEFVSNPLAELRVRRRHNGSLQAYR